MFVLTMRQDHERTSHVLIATPNWDKVIRRAWEDLEQYFEGTPINMKEMYATLVTDFICYDADIVYEIHDITKPNEASRKNTFKYKK